MPQPTNNSSRLSSWKKWRALLVRKFLSEVMSPLTGSLQRKDLNALSPHHSLFDRCTAYFIKSLSWCCNGAITLAYPHMQYNPITARRQAASWQWASEILDIPAAMLEKNATEFLREKQQVTTAFKTRLLSKLASADEVQDASDTQNRSVYGNTRGFSDGGATKQFAAEVEFRKKSTTPTFTILICFHHHLDFFKSCLDSIKEACHRSPNTSVEILIINDDPSIDLTAFLQETEKSLQEKITLHWNKENLGICSSANEAVARAQGEWILHLDCDDRLEPDVFLVLEKTIPQHCGVRFISSRAIDIDTKGNILFWRLRSERPYHLIKDNVASHLKIIRKDLHADLGLFNPIFQGCQDYEFALRTAINEPLCFISDYLYQYRWHHQSQTVSYNKRQNFTAMRIRQTYMLAIYWLTHGTEMLHWTITGPYADEWRKKSNDFKDASIKYEIALETTRPYTDVAWRLLLVKIATVIIDRYAASPRNSETTLEVKS